ncbi:hypothetical protein C8J57DRAFT_1604411 [Mycena rebaudengoi]|nr:hypothetical protein C8J57DRAFT_1604411 [Mycena rebaudengoi]
MSMEDLCLPSLAPSPGFDSMDVDSPPPPQNQNLQLPTRFIYVKHHAHSGKPNEIIALDSAGSSDSQDPAAKSPSDEHPWAPFRCLADATFAYRCVSRQMANRDVDEDLDLLRTEWADKTHVTFRNHREMERSLDAAREGNVRIRG